MTRTTQPYRKGPRPPGQALNAMLKGRTTSGFNPKDSQRNVQKLVRAGKQQMRPQRPDRPGRPDRPPRLASTSATDAQSRNPGGRAGYWIRPEVAPQRFRPHAYRGKRGPGRPIPTRTGSRGLRHDGPPDPQNMIYNNKRRRRLI